MSKLRRGHITVHTCGLSHQFSGAFIYNVTARYSSVYSSRSVPRLSSTSSTFSLFLSHSPLPLFVLVLPCQFSCRLVCGAEPLPLGQHGTILDETFSGVVDGVQAASSETASFLLFFTGISVATSRSSRLLWYSFSAVLPQLGFHVHVSPPRSRHLQRLRAKGVHGTQAVFWMDALLNPTWNLHFRVSGHETSPNPGGQQGSWFPALLTRKMCDHLVPRLSRGDGGAAPSTVSPDRFP